MFCSRDSSWRSRDSLQHAPVPGAKQEVVEELRERIATAARCRS